MKKNEKFVLIEGSFIPQEAKEILQTVYGDKIQFHQKKNFSSQERLGKEDVNSLERIPQLKNSLKAILEIIENAADKNRLINIHSEISISFITKE